MGLQLQLSYQAMLGQELCVEQIPEGSYLYDYCMLHSNVIRYLLSEINGYLNFFYILISANSLKFLLYFSNECYVFVKSKLSTFFIYQRMQIPSKSQSVFTCKGLCNISND
ncbi:MAG: hypothetical protein EZS28_034055 [Streblomastix strix]|uniref:Uncharacterized protein n=1 Tax=Streblomastix strix TaxID=222440 RepID=A0A5J4UID6_9EUKA|nr:MAG: hypothetical protein EZS28_034055 [Streblomastix strix]